jgi:tetratricopeptide (TPR) repeat protein
MSSLLHFSVAPFLIVVIYFGLAQQPAIAATTDGESSASKNQSASAISSQQRLNKYSELYTLAGQEMEKLNIEKARKIYQQIDTLSHKSKFGERARIVLKTELPRYPVSDECNDMYKQGAVLLRSANPNDALGFFIDMSKRFPKFEWAQAAMASLYIRMKDTDSAAQCARKALAINENFLQAWIVLIHEAIIHNDLEGELTTAKRAHELDPGNSYINVLLSRLLAEKNEEQPD